MCSVADHHTVGAVLASLTSGLSRYGTLKTWADELGLRDAVALLGQTLAEEKKADATLTEITESVKEGSR